MSIESRTLQSARPEPRTPVILVTGAGGGLGSALTRHLIKKQQRVVATSRDIETLSSLHSDPQALCFAVDASKEQDWAAALASTTKQWGPVTGAALCAGGWEGGKPYHLTEPEAWDRMFRINLDTMRVGLHVLLRHMLHHGRGSIVAVGSRAALRPWESTGAAAYAAAKAALVSLVQTAAAELTTSGVRVNAVLPTTIDTASNRKAMPTAPHERWASTQEVNNVISFLLSDDASGVNGAAIPVHGRL